jgi:hypothetical protein
MAMDIVNTYLPNISAMYYVPDGNWTNNVANSLGNNAVDVLNFGINRDVFDPANGCEKTFTATYKCGLGGTSKSLSVDKPADGKTARFDCAAEFGKCNDLKLTLTDDGKLTLTNTAGTTKFWDSVTAFGANGAFSTNTDSENAAIALPKHAGDGIVKNRDVGEGGGPGRRYPFNYLLSGQFLESGQWIGSPTGTCRLMMGTSAFPNSLQVVKSVPDCDSLDVNSAESTGSDYTDLGCWKDTSDRALSKYLGNGHSVESCYQAAKTNGSDTFGLQYYGQCWAKQNNDDYAKHGALPGACPPLGGAWSNRVFKIGDPVSPDTDATRLYTIPPVFRENVGKAGHVNNQGQLQLYPNSMISYNNNYQQIGNFKSRGAIFKSLSGSSIVDCQDACTSGIYSGGTGDTQQCAGFVFDTTNAMCNLLDNTMYQKQVLIKPDSNYYAREKGIINQDISCPADISIESTEFWNNINKNSTPMSPSTKCGLANYTQNQRNQVKSDLPIVNSNVQYEDESGNLSNDIKYDDVKSNPTLYNKNKNGFKYWMDSLTDKYNKLTNGLFNTKASLKSKMEELEESKKNKADWTGEQLQNLQAMTEDRDLNMMSQNYRHILWSILAIIIIIGTMKMTKAKAVAA